MFGGDSSSTSGFRPSSSASPSDRESLPSSGSSPSSERLYNPYADLPSYNPYNQKAIESIYRLPTEPEFLFTEEAKVQRRSFGDNLTFFAGCGWLGGATLGGGLGFAEGLRLVEQGDSWKIRVNRLLNASGHRGRTAGNTLGVLGLLYGGMEGAICHYRGTDDVLNSVLAGLGSGALYKAAAGPRTAAIAGALGGVAAATLTAGRQLSKRYLAF
eukprot:TRINITY_DN38595_c0_g1_i1.p1 TRINITY_DN38595_c0_g1~~TRINITY_DN38595_c0_g1_i1.p1  ORF type:complete len:214 (+),score=36.48 TRINITY_DN38595_c0_g1_i1:232-873(+)